MGSVDTYFLQMKIVKKFNILKAFLLKYNALKKL